jgi:hypothetical protein
MTSIQYGHAEIDKPLEAPATGRSSREVRGNRLAGTASAGQDCSHAELSAN